ncbi:MAG: hypothetical protein JWL77_7047 [Chthonomonadaceae bacterium]|nr:hypothetical protein [Chthonomonadaceae bacterium]
MRARNGRSGATDAAGNAAQVNRPPLHEHELHGVEPTPPGVRRPSQHRQVPTRSRWSVASRTKNCCVLWLESRTLASLVRHLVELTESRVMSSPALFRRTEPWMTCKKVAEPIGASALSPSPPPGCGASAS